MNHKCLSCGKDLFRITTGESGLIIIECAVCDEEVIMLRGATLEPSTEQNARVFIGDIR